MAAGRHALDIEVGRLDFTDHSVDRVVQSVVSQGLVDNTPHGLQGIHIRVRMDRCVHVGHHNRGEEK